MFSVWFPATGRISPGDERQLTAAMAKASHSSPHTATWASGSCAWAWPSVASATVGESRSSGALLDAPDTVRVVGWIRLDNATSLALRLNLPANATRTDADLVAAAWRRWGAAAVSELIGDFSFVLAHGSIIFAARDRVGVRPLFFTQTSSGFGAASSVAGCLAMPNSRRDVSNSWLLRYVIGDRTPTPDTPFPDVVRVMPGECAIVSSSGQAPSVSKWHVFEATASDTFRREQRWLHDYREAFLAAVSRRVPPAGPVGFESSGGLDSSSIIAAAAYTGTAAERIHTMTRMSNPQQDRQAAVLNRYVGISEGHEHLPSAAQNHGGSANLDWTVLGYPAQHPNSVGHRPFYALARELRIRSLFSGHGGDDGVTSHATQALHTVARRWPWLGPWQLSTPGLARPLRALQLRRSPVPQRTSTPRWVRNAANLPVRQDALAVHLEEPARSTRGGISVSEDVVRLGLPLVALRTEECSLMAANFGVSYEWPLLDSELIQIYLLAPDVWKFSDGVGRYLHRRAIEGIVPDLIRWDPRKLNASVSPLNVPNRATPDDTADLLRQRLRAGLHPALADILDLTPSRDAADLGPRYTAALRRATTLNNWLHDLAAR